MNIECPVCHSHLNAAIGERSPGPNDMTICVYCKSVLLFGPDSFQLLCRYEQLPKSIRESIDLSIAAFNQVMLDESEDGTIH